MKRRLPLLVTLLVLLTGCIGPSDPTPDVADEAPRPPKSVQLVAYEDGYGSTRTGLRGCASVADDEDAADSLPVLVWVRLHPAERLRLLPAVYAQRSNSIDSIAQHVGPDPGPDAPHLAVSIAPVGVGPTRNRQTSDTHLIGDVRDNAEGLVAAKKSWDARVELEGAGLRLEPGDHYLFVASTPPRAAWTCTASRPSGSEAARRTGRRSAACPCASSVVDRPPATHSSLTAALLWTNDK